MERHAALALRERLRGASDPTLRSAESLREIFF
jgi:hypothetical protein